MNEMTQILQRLTNLPVLALIMARIGGLIAFVPFFSSADVPVRARALLVGFISLAVFPFVGQFSAPSTLGGLVLAMLGEILIGLCFGFALNAVFSGLELAGLLIGQQLGIGLAQVFNPLFEEETSVIGQLYFWLAIIIFLIIRGHLILVGALVKSFHTLAPGSFQIDDRIVGELVDVLKVSFIVAVQVSAPVMIALFLSTLAVGFIGRTMPQLNIMSVEFSLRSLLGMVLLVVCLIEGLSIFFTALDKTFITLYRLVGL